MVDDVPFNLVPLEGMIEGSLQIKCVQFIHGFEAVSAFQQKLLAKCCNN
jgi:hypothetical protein